MIAISMYFDLSTLQLLWLFWCWNLLWWRLCLRRLW